MTEEIKKYLLRYEGKENMSYTEIDLGEEYNRREEPTDEFGRKLEETIRQLTEQFPTKSFDVNVISWSW